MGRQLRQRLTSCIVGLLAFGSREAVALTCAQTSGPISSTLVYVSPTGADSPTCGALGSPCQGIQKGIDNCVASGKTGCVVVVRFGSYRPSTSIKLVAGVDVWGSCTFDDSQPRYRTYVTGSPAFIAQNINAPQTLLKGFVIIGADATQPGQASVAMAVQNSSGLTVNSNLFVSGRGATGAAPGVSNGTQGEGGAGAIGNTGGSGGRACAANPTMVGMGGKGADFQQVYSSVCFLGCQCSNNNYPNSLGKNGLDSGSSKGGTGAGRSDQLGCMCGANGDPGDGGTGNPGSAGACGISGGAAAQNTQGSFSGLAWSPSQGGAGDPGKVGAGGGGGGSGGMATNVGGPDFPGLPGGGGGGGGCGAPGGQGGGQGGASIPLVLDKSTVAGLAVNNALIPGPGGTGGVGAAGGLGGSGGTGANGRKGHYTTVEQWAYCTGKVPGSGGTGGSGGQGGAAAGGAGGNGGPSSGIALVSSTNLYTNVVIYSSQPGTGGSKGTGGTNGGSQCTGGAGTAGVTGASNPILTYP